MKKILLPVFILLSLFVKGQIVNIPDYFFLRMLVNAGVDINNDQQIQVSEAEATTSLTFPSDQNLIFTNLTGLSSFVNVRRLEFYTYNQMLGKLDLSALTNLEYLKIDLTLPWGVYPLQPLDTVNLSGLSHLNYASVYCKMVSLNVSGCTNLNYLNCTGNYLTSLDISSLNNLQHLECSFNSLNALIARPSLSFLDYSHNNFSTLDLTNCSNLDTFICNHCQMNNIDLRHLPNLKLLSCSTNTLDSLDISMCPDLTTLDCSNNKLKYLNVKNGAIFSDYQYSIPFPIVDPPPHFESIYYTFYLKDSFLVVTPNDSLRYVCADDNEVDELINYFNRDNIFNVNVNSYCSFTPPSHFNTIKGKIRLDKNNDGCDSADLQTGYLKVKIKRDSMNFAATGYTDLNGNYIRYVTTGSYTVTPEFQNPYFLISPDSAIIYFQSIADSTQIANFCILQNGVHPDLSIKILPIGGRLRPGFINTYKLIFKNNGTETQAGNVQLNFDAAKLSFMNASPVTNTQISGNLNWNYTNLLPFESRMIDVTFFVSAPPVNNIGDSLLFTANISPINSDETPADNIDSAKQFFTGSFDPNDKTCLQGAIIDYSKKDEYVDYLIRFQNTGNDTAFNVVVKDILTDNYDWNSFELTKTSHPCVVNQTNGNKLEFIFEDINLPPKIANDSASNGFIAFKLKPKSTVVINDSLNNHAAIYFDYNLPVITNTAITILKQKTLPVKIEYFKGVTQSGKNMLTWKTNCTDAFENFKIERSKEGRAYYSIHNLTASYTRCLQPFEFTDANPFAGINYYRIKATDADGNIYYSNTITLLNQPEHFGIVSLTPIPVTNGSALLKTTAIQQQQISITILDVTGKTVRSFTKPLNAGISEIKLDLSNLSAGKYTIVILSQTGERRSKSFINK